MTNETVVHVETIEQWKSVLNVWFERGYVWKNGSSGYNSRYFNYEGSRTLSLNYRNSNNAISYWSLNDYGGENMIEYDEFMKEQEKTMAKETYYVTQEQIDLIEKLKSCLYPLHILVMDDGYKVMNFSFSEKEEKALLRYIGGDTSIEFKVKEQLYRLWRIDTDDDKVYMKFTKYGTPDWTMDEDYAFTAPLEEIKKHKTVSWDIEKAD